MSGHKSHIFFLYDVHARCLNIHIALMDLQMLIYGCMSWSHQLPNQKHTYEQSSIRNTPDFVNVASLADMSLLCVTYISVVIPQQLLLTFPLKYRR